MLFLYRRSPFILSKNLDEVFTYNNMALMSLRSRSHDKASIVLTRAYHLFIHNYIRVLLNNILRPILWSERGSNSDPTACVSDALAN